MQKKYSDMSVIKRNILYWVPLMQKTSQKNIHNLIA